ncbi:MAG TPA: GntR family transcriptional regulator [Steroidobacteraceae bacterium]
MLRIDLASRTPVYEQIVSAIRAELVAGSYRSGDRLPTVRALAIDLGVHHNTVAQAYRELATEGWLDLRRHRGATVRDRERPSVRVDADEKFTRPLRELIARALAQGLPRKSLVKELLDSARRLQAGAL